MSINKLNFVFFGTPDVASGTLEILKQNGFLPSLIVTSPDKPQGRKMLVTPPPAKIWAKENNIPYIQPEKLSEINSNANLFIVVAYGKMLPENILNIPKLGSINIHYSLLPKYRGASPVESAILNGDIVTGVTIQKMAYKMDAGDIIAKQEIEIDRAETAPELRKRLIKIGGELLVKTIPLFVKNEVTLKKQNENEATICTKIKKADGLLNLNDDAIKNYNKFRAYTYWPRTFFFKDGKRIIITNAILENNQFIILKVLPEGKKEIKYEEFLKTNV